MELDELHVHERQAGTQNHGVAVAGAGMRRGAGKIGAAVTPGGEYYIMSAEAVQGAGLQVPGHDTAAGAVLVHDQVQGEMLDIEFRLVLQRLLVKRMQNGMAGAIGGGAGALGGPLAEMGGHAAEGALIDLAVLGA